MKEALLTCSLFSQSITLLFSLITHGLPNIIFFAIFWASTIISLITILSMSTWQHEEWFGFSAITFSMVGGVLYAIRVLVHDALIISLIVVLLLLASLGQARKNCKNKKCLFCNKKHHKHILVEKKVEELPKVIIIEATPKAAAKKTTKKKTTKKTPNKKKTSKKAAKKTTKKSSIKSKKVKAISHNKFYKPKVATKKTIKKKTAKNSSRKKRA